MTVLEYVVQQSLDRRRVPRDFDLTHTSSCFGVEVNVNDVCSGGHFKDVWNNMQNKYWFHKTLETFERGSSYDTYLKDLRKNSRSVCTLMTSYFSELTHDDFYDVPIRSSLAWTSVPKSEWKSHLIQNHILSIAIYSADIGFLAYSSGILKADQCSPWKMQNHAVVLVGFVEKDGKNYWIIRNSFGRNWGIAGYAYMDIDSNACNPGYGYRLSLSENAQIDYDSYRAYFQGANQPMPPPSPLPPLETMNHLHRVGVTISSQQYQPAKKCIDGNNDNWCHSSEGPEGTGLTDQFVTLEVESESSIRYVVFYVRDGFEERINPFEIWVNNKTEAASPDPLNDDLYFSYGGPGWTYPYANHPFAPHTAEQVTSGIRCSPYPLLADTRKITVSCNRAITGQFVTIYLPGKKRIINIAEMRAYS